MFRPFQQDFIVHRFEFLLWVFSNCFHYCSKRLKNCELCNFALKNGEIFALQHRTHDSDDIHDISIFKCYNFFLPWRHNLPRLHSIVHYRANKNKWSLFRHVSLTRTSRVEYWDVAFCPCQLPILSFFTQSLKNVFIGSFSCLLSVDFLSGNENKKNWCAVFAMVFIYRSCCV